MKRGDAMAVNDSVEHILDKEWEGKPLSEVVEDP